MTTPPPASPPPPFAPPGASVPPPPRPEGSTSPTSRAALQEEPRGQEEPWGPIRLRWRGKYLSPELATLVFLLSVTVVFVLGAVLWRSFGGASTDAGLSDADAGRGSTLSSAATQAPGGNDARTALPRKSPSSRASSSPASPKPSAALPQPGPGTGEPSPQPRNPAPDRVTPAPASISPSPAPVQAPVISSFSSSSQAVDPGGSATLSWTVSGEAQKVIISPDPGIVGLSGESPVHPAQSTQYVITATGPGGSASDQIFVHVNTTPAPSVDFGADTTQLKLGQSATLRWRVSGADQVTIDPGIGTVNSSGSMKVKPLGTIRYTLLARGAGVASGRTLVLQVTGTAGPSSGQLVWSGVVSGTQLVTIDHDRADVGTLSGSLPGLPCILQPTDERKVGIASAPSPGNGFDRLVLRVTGHGQVTVAIRWSLL